MFSGVFEIIDNDIFLNCSVNVADQILLEKVVFVCARA